MDMVGPIPNLRSLHIYNLEGPGDRFMASGDSLEFISWAPDSQHFFYKIQGGEEEGLYAGGFLQMPVRLVDNPHSIGDLQWVDGTHFVYLVNNNNIWELHLSNVNADDLGLIDALSDESPDFDVLP